MSVHQRFHHTNSPKSLFAPTFFALHLLLSSISASIRKRDRDTLSPSYDDLTLASLMGTHAHRKASGRATQPLGVPPELNPTPVANTLAVHRL
jgi:hypothetical protein